MFKFPGELPIVEIRYVEEVPCRGKEEEISNDARGGFNDCRGNDPNKKWQKIEFGSTYTCLLALFQTCQKEDIV